MVAISLATVSLFMLWLGCLPILLGSVGLLAYRRREIPPLADTLLVTGPLFAGFATTAFSGLLAVMFILMAGVELSSAVMGGLHVS